MGLLEGIRQGNPQAFSTYYEYFVDPMVLFLFKILRNEEEAKEIAQDVFALLWENRSQIIPEKAVGGIIYGTAKNMAYRVLRRRSIHMRYENERQFADSDTEFPADESVIFGETSSTLEDALASLPPQQRRVYEAARIEGKPIKEVADEMGISYETARTHMKRASKTVKESLTMIILAMFI